MATHSLRAEDAKHYYKFRVKGTFVDFSENYAAEKTQRRPLSAGRRPLSEAEWKTLKTRRSGLAWNIDFNKRDEELKLEKDAMHKLRSLLVAEKPFIYASSVIDELLKKNGAVTSRIFAILMRFVVADENPAFLIDWVFHNFNRVKSCNIHTESSLLRALASMQCWELCLKKVLELHRRVGRIYDNKYKEVLYQAAFETCIRNDCPEDYQKRIIACIREANVVVQTPRDIQLLGSTLESVSDIVSPPIRAHRGRDMYDNVRNFWRVNRVLEARPTVESPNVGTITSTNKKNMSKNHARPTMLEQQTRKKVDGSRNTDLARRGKRRASESKSSSSFWPENSKKPHAGGHGAGSSATVVTYGTTGHWASRATGQWHSGHAYLRDTRGHAHMNPTPPRLGGENDRTVGAPTRPIRDQNNHVAPSRDCVLNLTPTTTTTSLASSGQRRGEGAGSSASYDDSRSVTPTAVFARKLSSTPSTCASGGAKTPLEEHLYGDSPHADARKEEDPTPHSYYPHHHFHPHHHHHHHSVPLAGPSENPCERRTHMVDEYPLLDEKDALASIVGYVGVGGMGQATNVSGRTGIDENA